MPDWVMTQGDGGILQGTCTRPGGTAVDFTGWTTPQLLLRHQETGTTITLTAELVAPVTSGVIKFEFDGDEQSGGPLDDGGWDFRFRVTQPNGEPKTFPNSGWASFRVVP